MQIDGMGSVAANAVRSAQVSAEQSKSTVFADELKNIQSADAAKDKKLKEACQGFEEMFLNLVYSKMRETVPDDPLFGNSNGEKIMQSMLDSELTKQMAKAGGVGMADMVYKQIKKDQSTIVKRG